MCVKRNLIFIIDFTASEHSPIQNHGIYDSDDDDEGNSGLIIEEEDNLRIDEPELDDIYNKDSAKSPNNRNTNTTSPPNSNSNSNSSNANDDEPMQTPSYAAAALFGPSVTNKLDLTQFMQRGSDKKTDSNIGKSDDGAIDSMMGGGSPKRPGTTSFEFFSRQIPETSHPAPQALDEKTPLDYDSSGTFCFGDFR